MGAMHVTTGRIDLGAQRAIRAQTAIPGWLVALIGVGGAVAAFGLVHPAYFTNLGARATIETMITMSAIAAAALLVIRFGQTRRLRDLLLLSALATVSLVDFPSSVLPAMIGVDRVVPSQDVQMIAQAFVALVFLAAAFAPVDRIVEGRTRPLLVIAAIGGLAIVLVDLIPLLTHGYAATASAHKPGLSSAAAHPVKLALHVGNAALMIIAALGFLRNGDRSEQEPWMLATAAILLAAARLQYVTFTAVDSDWVTPASALRVLAYCLLLTAAVRHYSRMRQEAAQAALVAERERIARDLHDGLAQDLAFIASHSVRLASEFGEEHPLTVASKRALAASRGAIVDLAASHEPTTGDALRSVADELESRYEVEISVSVESGDASDLEREEREQIVRIAREAIVNAIRHGGAGRVDVELGSHDSGLLLRVSDDGCGMVASSLATRGTGLGMRAMRARARRVGANLVAKPAPNGGTRVEVVL
jgi:signal transduction histidine kinase